MSGLYKAGLALAVMAGCFFAGWYTRKPLVQTKTQTVEHETVVTKVVTVTEKQPDGTATTTTTTSTTADTTTKTDVKHPTQPVPGGSNGVRVPRYSAAVQWTPRLDADAYKPTGIELGRRIGETNAWVTGGYDWRTKAVTAGLRVEF